MDRGIVTPAVEIIVNGNSLSLGGVLPPENLRYMALYWDKVVITETNIFGCSLPEEAPILMEAGILDHRIANLSLNGSFNGSDFAAMQFDGLVHIADQLFLNSPGQWTLHQVGNNLYLPNGSSNQLVTADFELNRCLPVPTSDHSIEDLIKFKFERQDELVALRQTMDELYLAIANSQDIPRAKIIQITKLEKAISDLDKVAKESWGKRLLASRKVSLDLGIVSQGIVTAGIVGSTFNNPLAGLFAGVGHSLAASMKFEICSSEQLRSSIGKQIDLSYVSSLKKEHIIN